RLLGPGTEVVAWLRIGYFVVVAGVAVKWLLIPMLIRSSDALLARYIEEKHPPFRQALVTAVDWLESPAEPGGSPGLKGRVLAAARAEMTQIADGRAIEATDSSATLTRLGVVVALGVALLLF